MPEIIRKRAREKDPAEAKEELEAASEMLEAEEEVAKEELAELEKPEVELEHKEEIVSAWKPKTSLGKKVLNGEIKNIDQILDSGAKILEPEIVDILLPGLQHELLAIGQSKGKFGGGKRSIWKQTQKKTAEGNKPKFQTAIVVGNKDGYVGIGFGKSKETVPAREKALKRAKQNIIKIKRGCGSWACACKEPHSIPFVVEGKCGSVKVKLIPAPKGAGLVAESETRKILELAGIKDVYSEATGQASTKMNLVKAVIDALKNLNSVKVSEEHARKLGIVEGAK